jgi:hypothetical protein
MGGQPPVKFAVDKVAQPPERISQRNAGYDEIGHAEKIQTVFAHENGRRHHHADEPAVIGHAGDAGEVETAGKLEGQDDLQGVVQVVGEVVEAYIAQTGADNQPEDHGRHEPLELFNVQVESVFPPDAVARQQVSDGKSHDIHEPVVLKLEPADFKNDRVHVRRQMLPPE